MTTTASGKKSSDVPKSERFQDIDPKKWIGTDYSYKHKIVWINVVGFFIIHIISVYCLFEIIIGRYKIESLVWAFVYGYMSGEGISLGAHRYFSHRSFKATKALQIILLTLQAMAGQNSLFIWVRDHRLHHRYSDTDGDPHNAKRGFFFSHIGWLMTKKHPYVKELGKSIDMSDMLADPLVMLQKKYYYYIFITFGIIIPITVPIYFFQESFSNSLLLCIFRYVYQLNGTWLTNSAAHLYGTRPYDRNIQPVESWFVSFISLGEGWHNYHHAFPWDFKAAELSGRLNGTAAIIKFLERIGLAYDLKTASPEVVEKRIFRTGDGTHYQFGDEVSRAQVTALGPLHPFNPSYNSTLKRPDAVVKTEGFPLFHENDYICD